MFELLGLLFAMAWYNGITIPINLPSFFYHSLMTETLNIYTAVSWIEDIAPEIASSLQNLPEESLEDLDWAYPMEANGLRLTARLATPTEDCLHFDRPEKPMLHVYDISTIGKSPFVDQEGEQPIDHTVENLGIEKAWSGWCLVDSPTPSEPITAENKMDYIKGYVAWLTILSVLPQYHAFHKGIRKIFGPEHPAPQVFLGARSAQKLLEGEPRFNIDELKAVTTYDGCTHDPRYIGWFWSIVKAWPQERQLKLLKFVTAMERLPFGGAATLKFNIETGNSASGENLPTSSTCFGTLYLPRYENKEILAQKLELAVEMGSEGFGVS